MSILDNMSQRNIYLVIFIIYYQLSSSHSTTHWFLNNEGKIQAQMDSIYQLRRPYDFLALIQQEERAKHVEQLKKELVEQKAHIDKNEDKDTQLEERIYRTYTDCILAGRPLTEFDLYASAALDLKSAGIEIEDFLDLKTSTKTDNYLMPDCQSLIDIPFSMFLLEHLKGMRFRDNLTALPEEDSSNLSSDKEPHIWGHRVADALMQNKTSWVLYILAAEFWKIKGNTQQAMECIRRSIFFSTREYRYISLFHLGNILHRSHESEDAAIVLHMALDHHKRSPIIHEMLGCVYATVGYYNESVLCLENALHLSPKDENLKKLKHAVLCHAHLENALEKQLQSLQHTLNELRGYQKKHDEWLNLQQKLLLEQATPEMKLESRLEYEEQKIRESADGRGQDCFQYQQDGHTFLSCNMRRDQLEHQGSSTELLLDLQSLLHTVESETMRLGQQVLKRKPNLPTSVPYVTPLSPAKGERSKPLYHNPISKLYGENFPSQKDCENNQPLPPWDAFPTVFLPTENKGFFVDELFKHVSVTLDEEMSPMCSGSPSEFIEEVDNIPGIKEKSVLLSVQPDFGASPDLNVYGLHLYDAETEAKLASAVRQEGDTRWVFLNLAALYWRINGNLANGVDCLRQAVIETPKEFLDVPFVNLASLLYKGGHIDDALTLTLKAIQVNATEVATNFLLANLYFGKGNLTGASYHYEKVLTVFPSHAEAQQYFTALACHIKNPQKSSVHATCSNSQKIGQATLCSEGEDRCSQPPSFESKVDEMDLSERDELSTRDNKCLSESPAERKDSVDSKANLNKQIHVRIGLGPETQSATIENAMIEDDPLPDVLLRVREKAQPQVIPPHLCDKGNKLSDIKLFTSTWLSVSAKNIDLTEYLVPPPKEGTSLEEPICPQDFPASLHTFDHLAGVKYRAKLPHYPELGLKEAFQTLMDKTPQQMDLVATRIARSLKKNETSWVIATAAALYWRVLGNGEKAMDCLRLALHHAPRNMKDIPLISMANIFHRSDLLNNALIVGSMALEISPNFVVIHFTMANMYAAKGDFDKAIAFYQSTLSLQSSFEPARERLRIIQCAISSSDSKL